MQYRGTLISVKDIERAKYFYETLLEQTVVMDLGEHLSFENGLSLQSNYKELVGAEIEPLEKEDNFQLYFEVEDLEAWYQKLSSIDGITFLHAIKEYPWAQQTMRLYDFDQHLIEISESMEHVVKRMLQAGVSVEDTAEKTMFPLEVVQTFLETDEGTY